MIKLTDIKAAAIKLFGLGEDATDAEVHDAILQAGETADGLRESVTTQIQAAIEENVSAQVSAVTDQISALTARVSSIEEAAKTGDDLTVTVETFNELKARVDTAEAANGELKTKLDEATALVQTLSGEVAAIKAAAGVETKKVPDPNMKTPVEKPNVPTLVSVDTPILAEQILPKRAGVSN